MLPNEVNERLELLLSSGQIQKKTFQVVKEQLLDLIQTKQVTASSENLGPFASHLAIAIERIEKSEGLEQTNDEVEQVMKKHPNLFQFAKKILHQCVDPSAESYVTRPEVGFIALYLLLLQENY